MRVYILPIYTWTHPKYGNTAHVAVCNRKQGFGPKQLALEGALGLFGGGVEKGETPIEALMREIQEEIPALLSGLPDLQEKLCLVFSNPTTQIYTVEAGVWTQQEYQKLAASCTEGAVDALYIRPEGLDALLKTQNLLSPVIEEVLLQIFSQG